MSFYSEKITKILQYINKYSQIKKYTIIAVPIMFNYPHFLNQKQPQYWFFEPDPQQECGMLRRKKRHRVNMITIAIISMVIALIAIK